MEDFNFLPSLQDPIDDAIEMRLLAIDQMAEAFGLWCNGASGGALLECENGALQSPKPLVCRSRVFSVNGSVDGLQVPLSALRNSNEVCNASP